MNINLYDDMLIKNQKEVMLYVSKVVTKDIKNLKFDKIGILESYDKYYI